MPKTYSAKIVELSKSLECAQCKVRFQGSPSQAFKVYYEKGAAVYCSAICRHAMQREKFGKPIPNRGPCPTCNQTFFSRTAKMFCSLKCYISSRQFAAAQKAAVEASRGPKREQQRQKFMEENMRQCPNCKQDFYHPPAKAKKYCSNSCRREYFAGRFDRWVASPEGIALPQNFDEFLTQQELPCLVEGCGWVGNNLSVHMNAAHGVPAHEFKRAAGFNMGTGVVSAPTRAALEARENVGVGLIPPTNRGGNKFTGYKSLESKEHLSKARAAFTVTTVRDCERCGQEFSPPTFNSRFCSRSCRLDTWYESRKVPKPPRQRNEKGLFISRAEEKPISAMEEGQ